MSTRAKTQAAWDKGFDAGWEDALAREAKPNIWSWGARAVRCGVIKQVDFLQWRDGYDEGYSCGNMSAEENTE